MRLNRALNDAGIESAMLVCRKHGNDVYVKEMPPVKKALARLGASLAYRALLKLGFYRDGFKSVNVFPSMLVHQLNRSDADVIHLHWVNSEMISIAALATFKKPVVWTFHDMWPFCGAEHLAKDTRYVTGYQSSEFGAHNSETKAQGLKSKAFFDLDRWVFRRKQKHWKNWHPCIVTPSNWMAECVRESMLFRGLPVEVIPNGLDLNVFKPMDQSAARQRFNLPLDKKLVLFGAYNPFDQNKGGDLLTEALAKVQSACVELVVFGAAKGPQIAGLPTHWMGSFSSEPDLAQLYNTADAVIVPSRQENLPNTVAEALSCGIPVAAFNIGGIPDMVVHRENGYLALPYDVDDLAQGIDWLLQAADGSSLRQNARNKAEQCFDAQQVAARYIKVYNKILKK